MFFLIVQRQTTVTKICLLVFLIVVCGQAFNPVVAHASSQPYIPAHQINFGTGNKYLSATDASLAGPEGTLSFSRTYNSQSTTTGALGYGWSATLTERLIIETSAINLVQEGGRYVVFKNDGSGNWINETGKKRSITANGSGYQLKEPSGTIRQYDSSGRLLSITDRNSNTQSYTYKEKGDEEKGDGFIFELSANHRSPTPASRRSPPWATTPTATCSPAPSAATPAPLP